MKNPSNLTAIDFENIGADLRMQLCGCKVLAAILDGQEYCFNATGEAVGHDSI